MFFSLLSLILVDIGCVFFLPALNKQKKEKKKKKEKRNAAAIVVVVVSNLYVGRYKIDTRRLT